MNNIAASIHTPLQGMKNKLESCTISKLIFHKMKYKS